MKSITKSKANIVGLANKIKSGELETSPIELDLFFEMDCDGVWQPDLDTRIQVRSFYRDTNFIGRQVQHYTNTGDSSNLDPLTVVVMPDGTYKLVNGAHTSEIAIKIGKTYLPAHILSWEDDLGGKMVNAKRLGNLLNYHPKEKQHITTEDVRNEFLELMADRKAEGLDAIPPEEEIQEFLTVYPFISRNTVGQWISHSPEGGRQQPIRIYEDSEKEDIVKAISALSKYEDYVVLPVMELNHALDSNMASAFKMMAEKKKKKCYIPMYCSNMATVKKWEHPDQKFKKKIDGTYETNSEYWGCIIEYEVLKWYKD